MSARLHVAKFVRDYFASCEPVYIQGDTHYVDCLLFPDGEIHLHSGDDRIKHTIPYEWTAVEVRAPLCLGFPATRYGTFHVGELDEWRKQMVGRSLLIQIKVVSEHPADRAGFTVWGTIAPSPIRNEKAQG